MDSEQLRNVYAFAERWVKGNYNSVLGSKHLLLGLVCVQSRAQEVLNSFYVTPKSYRIASDNRGYGGNTLLLDQEATELKRRAATICTTCNADYVEPEHLLMAIVLMKECYAYQSLVEMGVDVVAMFKELTKTLKNRALFVKKLSAETAVSAEKKTAANDVKYCIDMTEKAKNGEYDPIIGRENELSRIVQTLVRRTKNNPLLIGEAGVGKSAVVEGLAQAIVDKKVPEVMQGKKIYALDIASMVAGTHYRGDFEQRLKDTIDSIQQTGNIIIFIDEIHNLVGAGATNDSSMDAVEILKPLLARGQLQVLGATTVDEYRKYIENDPALERRFQPVTIGQPTVEQAVEILKGVKGKYQEHHKVTITDEAVLAAVNLSHRYIIDRNLPDKAFDVLDEACSATMLSGKKQVGFEQIAKIVSDWTGIPVGKLNDSDKTKLLSLEKELQKRVVGQRNAIEAVARAIKRQRAGIASTDKPIGSFIFAGFTGVGKTELAKALAECLFLNKEDLIRFDMSEYMDKTSVSKLLGTSAGYEGYSDGGLLTEKVRRKPYSVVLFDEIEKAHVDIFNVLLQILDEGKLTDNRGRVVDFKNTVVILTSNLGTDKADTDAPYESLQKTVLGALKAHFRAEFLNRIDEIIVFSPLNEQEIKQIAKLMCDDLCKRVKNITLTVTEQALDYLVKVGYDKEYGARPLKRAIQRNVEDALSEMFLSGKIAEKDTVTVDAINDKLYFR